MPTDFISDFFLVDNDGDQVSFEVFRTREEAQARIDRAPEEVRGEISIKEVRTPARFLAIVSNRQGLRAEVENYLWFRARVEHEGRYYVIVGTAAERAEAQALRLHSGLLGASVWPTLEEAVDTAENAVGILYGHW